MDRPARDGDASPRSAAADGDALRVLLCDATGQLHTRLSEGLVPAASDVSDADGSGGPDRMRGVMHRRFSTPRRLFELAVPQGGEALLATVAVAEPADIAVFVVAAQDGVLEPTQRLIYLCQLRGIRRVVLCVDADAPGGLTQDAFEAIASAFTAYASALDFQSSIAIPISVAGGDNISGRSQRCSWYGGPSLLACLEDGDVWRERGALPLRFFVDTAQRADGDCCAVAGRVVSGDLRIGEALVAVYSGAQATVAGIGVAAGSVTEARPGNAVTLMLADVADIAGGELLAPAAERPDVSDQFAAHVVWLGEESLLPGRSYRMLICGSDRAASVTTIKYRVDVATLQHLAARELGRHEIGFCNLVTAGPVAFDTVADNPATGVFTLVDRQSHATVGCGMIAFGLRRANNIHVERLMVDRATRAAAKRQQPTVIWFTGLSGSGKSTLAKQLEKRLADAGRHTYVLDGDNIRHGLNRDLGFTDADRVENIRRIGEVAKLFVDAGLIVLCSFISPFRAERRMVRDLFSAGEFIEVFVSASLEVCERRDPKGLYAKVRAGQMKNFTGIDSPYEFPEHADICLDTEASDVDSLVDRLVTFLHAQGRL